MSLSQMLLLIWVFLVATVQQLAWFALSSRLIGLIGLAYVIVYLLEVAGIITLNLPLARRH